MGTSYTETVTWHDAYPSYEELQKTKFIVKETLHVDIVHTPG